MLPTTLMLLRPGIGHAVLVPEVQASTCGLAPDKTSRADPESDLSTDHCAKELLIDSALLARQGRTATIELKQRLIL